MTPGLSFEGHGISRSCDQVTGRAATAFKSHLSILPQPKRCPRVWPAARSSFMGSNERAIEATPPRSAQSLKGGANRPLPVLHHWCSVPARPALPKRAAAPQPASTRTQPKVLGSAEARCLTHSRRLRHPPAFPSLASRALRSPTAARGTPPSAAAAAAGVFPQRIHLTEKGEAYGRGKDKLAQCLPRRVLPPAPRPATRAVAAPEGVATKRACAHSLPDGRQLPPGLRGDPPSPLRRTPGF